VVYLFNVDDFSIVSYSIKTGIVVRLEVVSLKYNSKSKVFEMFEETNALVTIDVNQGK